MNISKKQQTQNGRNFNKPKRTKSYQKMLIVMVELLNSTDFILDGRQLQLFLHENRVRSKSSYEDFLTRNLTKEKLTLLKKLEPHSLICNLQYSFHP